MVDLVVLNEVDPEWLGQIRNLTMWSPHFDDLLEQTSLFETRNG